MPTVANTSLPCIVCHKELENAGGSTRDADAPIENQPIHGTAFTSHGHYGSMFDPMRGGVFLELNICDDCLRREATAGNVYLGRTPRVDPRVDYEPYDPQEYYGD